MSPGPFLALCFLFFQVAGAFSACWGPEFVHAAAAQRKVGKIIMCVLCGDLCFAHAACVYTLYVLHGCGV